jgi:hypothetical protein
MVAGKIIDLRRLLAEKFPHEELPPSDRLATGLPIFDQAPGGGLTKSAITEISSSAESAGSASLIAGLLHRAAGERSFLALIDGRDSFDPQSIDPPVLSHLLWVRCHTASEAMKAADLLLRDGNFPLLILDLVLNPVAELRKIPSSYWYRLQRLVEPASTALLAFTPRSMIASAQCKLRLENRWTLAELNAPATELQAGMKAGVEKIQLNKWRGEKVAC